MSGPGAGSDARLSENAACDRCIILRRHVKYAADFFANVCSVIGRALAAAEPPAMDTSTDSAKIVARLALTKA